MEFCRIFTFRRIASVALPLLIISFLRLGDKPSLADRAQERIRSIWDESAEHTQSGKPKFRSTDRSTKLNRAESEQRMRNFFARHPSLEPVWRDVPYDENGFLLLRDFVEGDPPPNFSVDESIRKMMQGEAEWDPTAVSKCLQQRHELLAKLHHIASMPDRSAKGVPWDRLDFFGARPYIQAAELLALSMTQHLRTADPAAALADFTTAHRLASHIDQHEVPTLLSKTASIWMRMQLSNQLLRELESIPADTDLTPWIRQMSDVMPTSHEMARTYRGEGLATISLVGRDSWFKVANITAFEDAMADQTMLISDSLERDGRLPESEAWSSKALEWRALGPESYELLTDATFPQLMKNAMRSYSKSAMALAALQILEAERTNGAITEANDPRLAGIAHDPSTGKPFIFDPSARQLSPDEDSAMAEKDEKITVHLPKR